MLAAAHTPLQDVPPRDLAFGTPGDLMKQYYAACEQGFCECGFYNGMRAEAFDGPIKPVKGKLRKDALKWGYAEHHIDEETGEM